MQQEKVFGFEIFVFEYVSTHTESIPAKKNRPKNFDFAIFHHFCQKTWICFLLCFPPTSRFGNVHEKHLLKIGLRLDPQPGTDMDAGKGGHWPLGKYCCFLEIQ